LIESIKLIEMVKFSFLYDTNMCYDQIIQNEILFKVQI